MIRRSLALALLEVQTLFSPIKSVIKFNAMTNMADIPPPIIIVGA